MRPSHHLTDVSTGGAAAAAGGGGIWPLLNSVIGHLLTVCYGVIVL